MSLIQDRVNQLNESSASEENQETEVVVETPQEEVIEKPIEQIEEVQEPVTERTIPEGYENYLSPTQVEEMKSDWEKDNATPNSPQETPLHETALKINEYLSKGGELNETYFKYQNLDLDKSDLNDMQTALDLIERDLIDVKGLTQAQASFTLEKNYPHLYRDIDSDDPDEVRQYDNDLMQASIDVKRALPSLKEYQQSVLLPKQQASNQPSQADIESQQLAMNKYLADAKNAVDSFSKLTLQVNKDVSIDIDTNSESMKGVTDLLMNPDKHSNFLVDNYVTKDGIDFERFKTDEFWRNNREAIMKEHYIQAYNIGKEEALKENGLSPTITNRGKTGGASNGNTVAQQVLSNMRR